MPGQRGVNMSGVMGSMSQAGAREHRREWPKAGLEVLVEVMV